MLNKDTESEHVTYQHQMLAVYMEASLHAPNIQAMLLMCTR